MITIIDAHLARMFCVYPANMPTRQWLTPSGVNIPTSDITKEIKSGLLGLSSDVASPKQRDTLTWYNPPPG